MATKKKIEDLVEEQTSPGVDAPVEPQDVPAEADVAPVVPKPVGVTVASVLVEDGDSYASLGAKYAPAGVSAHEFAKELVALNGGAVLRAGGFVKIRKG